MLWSLELPLSDFQNWLSWCCTEIREEAIGITLCNATVKRIFKDKLKEEEKVKVSPLEWAVPVRLQEQPVDHGRPIAGPHDGHVAPVHHWVLVHNLLDQVKDEGDVVSLALLVVHVPAPLVTIGCHHHSIVPQEIQPPDTRLPTVAMEVDNQRKLLPISRQSLRQLQNCFSVKALGFLAPTLTDSHGGCCS